MINRGVQWILELDSIEEEAITSSSHIRLIRWTQPVSRNRSRNTNEGQERSLPPGGSLGTQHVGMMTGVEHSGEYLTVQS